MSAIPISQIKMTARQFFQLGEDPAGVRLELVDGEVAVSPSPNPNHSYTEKALSALLFLHIEQHDLGQLLGDVDTIFGEYDVRRPDLIFYSTSRLHLIGDGPLDSPPDLCVEIISPSSVRIDRQTKFELYEQGGVKHFWIVDPIEQTIEAWTLSSDTRYEAVGQGRNDEVVQLPPFESLSLPLQKLWRPRVG